MNGKDMKWMLPLGLVAVLILGAVGIALMGGEKKGGGGNGGVSGPYNVSIGPITDSTGKTLSGATVALMDENVTLATATTNSSGMATLSLAERIEEKDYTVRVEAEGYKSVSVSAHLSFDGTTAVLTLDKEPVLEAEVKVLQIEVGPIKGKLRAIQGASVTLLRAGVKISEGESDANGLATLLVEAPIEDGSYVITVSAKGYESVSIPVTLNYNETSGVLNVGGEISDITLEPEKPKQDLDYYKNLEAYREIDGDTREPVDVRSDLDPDGDERPVVQDEGMEKVDQNDVDVSPWVGEDDSGEPEYSPEIANYEPEDFDEYVDNASGTRSNANATSNLTLMDDVVNTHEILDNQTDEVMNYTSNATDTSEVKDFQAFVTQSLLIINRTLEFNYINGTNATDADGDGNYEHLVMWAAAYLKEDRNHDGVVDHKAFAINVTELWDNNSNGVVDHYKALRAAKRMYDNDTDGVWEDVLVAVGVGEAAVIDGNITEHYTRMGVFLNHTIDANGDNNTEYHVAVVYVVEERDNNSNGHYEYKHSYVAAYEALDANDNGYKENETLVLAGEELEDRNDDGVWDHNTSRIWILHRADSNEDGNNEVAAGLVIAKAQWDNNSNGHFEDVNNLILGYREEDADSDGNAEIKDLILAVSKDLDRNDDGAVDMNFTLAYAFSVRDSDGDGIYEERRGFHYARAMYDNNTNGHFETKYQQIVGFIVRDPDSNGVDNEVRAVYFATADRDRNDDGTYDYNRSMAMVLGIRDSDEDGNPEWKHAVFGGEERWDNNTDGIWDNRTTFLAGYEGYDNDSNGYFEEERVLLIFNRTRDMDGDGNPESISFFVAARYRLDLNQDNLSDYERNVYMGAEMWDNNSNGHFEYVRGITAGHEGINATMNGTNMTWEEEHVLIFYTQVYDYDDDGTVDAKEGAKVAF